MHNRCSSELSNARKFETREVETRSIARVPLLLLPPFTFHPLEPPHNMTTTQGDTSNQIEADSVVAFDASGDGKGVGDQQQQTRDAGDSVEPDRERA